MVAERVGNSDVLRAPPLVMQEAAQLN